jgi:hypothetical protein
LGTSTSHAFCGLQKLDRFYNQIGAFEGFKLCVFAYFDVLAALRGKFQRAPGQIDCAMLG